MDRVGMDFHRMREREHCASHNAFIRWTHFYRLAERVGWENFDNIQEQVGRFVQSGRNRFLETEDFYTR